MEIIDENLTLGVNPEEVEKVIEVAVLCTNASPSLRPTMSEVVRMLEGEISIPDNKAALASVHCFLILVLYTIIVMIRGTNLGCRINSVPCQNNLKIYTPRFLLLGLGAKLNPSTNQSAIMVPICRYLCHISCGRVKSSQCEGLIM
ncbi:hypothetical protein CRG98_010524 [Punica granatum]|uniref:Serine-threonine/tyrosine-protein kinase catalytic domain-containing protein n=1 Tax=Punica granatum TaxID=22663 RepID=A0A2I0KKL1_PUNGR|nr:hypothetical protein CRG98_010524 [Punica granatum]